ncbi:MAG: GNAT family N-acetyltransferase [Pseudomonadota bacterium]|nr:GNAT family N-acetyltransferase [Pseudomonadota bacterium]
MLGLDISGALTSIEMEACMNIRNEVFCTEQKVSLELEFDGLDDVCRHLLARLGNYPVGTARTRSIRPEVAKFERVAVLQNHRGSNIGRALMHRAMVDAAGDGHTLGLLHAQSYAEPFYRKLGFVQEGVEFEEAGIPHVKMIRLLKDLKEI